MVMNTVIKRTSDYLTRWDVILFLATTLPLVVFPHIDIWASRQFFMEGQFFLAHVAFVEFIYYVFARIHLFFFAVFVVGLIITFVRKTPKARLWRKKILFLLLVMLLGPGLLVNGILKDHSFGRPRPIQVEQFGGHDHFAPALRYSGECRTNCSFVCGHASIAFFVMAFAWVFRRRYLFTAGLALGILVGLVRMVQGGHFLSDVVFAFWAVYFTILPLAYLFKFELKLINDERKVKVRKVVLGVVDFW
ncbi:MAG: hypothetical protein CENE_01192 [Candidatus Celerinatantimonas neptuna]|nr:MAG: hypothetical protein CENE_01192 [Candidatus Celerinatantimonas neptuna]